MLTTWVMRLLPTIPLALAIGAACGEPDPNYGDPGSIIGKQLPGGGGAAGASGGDGGAGGAADPFGGAYDPNANKPTKTLKDAHAAGGGPTPDTVGDCLTCHVTGGAAASVPWAFGGRAASKAAGIDVIVTNGTAKIGPVKTDADGFFWAPGGPVAAQSKVAMRNASSTASMVEALLGAKDGGCMQANSCHGGSQGPPGTGVK